MCHCDGGLTDTGEYLRIDCTVLLGCLHLCYVKSDAAACGSERSHNHGLVRHLHGTINVDQHGPALSDSVPGNVPTCQGVHPAGMAGSRTLIDCVREQSLSPHADIPGHP